MKELKALEILKSELANMEQESSDYHSSYIKKYTPLYKEAISELEVLQAPIGIKNIADAPTHPRFIHLEYENIRKESSTYQIGGDHYQTKIQPWDIIDSWDLNFYEGNILKYLLRRKNNRVEDLKKMIHYAQKLLEIEEGKI